MNASNRLNKISFKENKVIKEGPSNKLKAEYLMYKLVSGDNTLQQFFPYIYSYIEKENTSIIELHYIEGVTLYNKYKNCILIKEDLINILDMVELFHNKIYEITINEDDIKNYYYDKLYSRITDKIQYPFDDLIQVKEKLFILLEKMLETYKINIVPFIHGDLWFSNIIINGNIIKVIDVRGMIGKIYTTNGDKIYDYAKLYQSILGFDYIIYGDKINEMYLSKTCILFEDELKKRNIDITHIKYMTLILMAGSIYFIDDFKKKLTVWNLIKKIMHECGI